MNRMATINIQDYCLIFKTVVSTIAVFGNYTFCPEDSHPYRCFLDDEHIIAFIEPYLEQE
jgi:hypothetical protein